MPVSWAPPVHRASGQEVSLRALGKRLGSTSYFSLCLTATTLPDCSWLKGLTKGHSDSWLLVGGAHCSTDQCLSRTPNSSVVTFTCGEGNGTPLQYSCLENPMDGGACWAAVHGVAKSRTRPSDFTFTFHFHALEREMATHSSVLAWRIPGTGEPGGLPSMGSHRVRHD